MALIPIGSTNPTVESRGDLYQWGRGADGHQVRTSLTTDVQATTWHSGNLNTLGSTPIGQKPNDVWSGKFIEDFINWLETGETHMWAGLSAENNPCPSGFRIPTIAEWNQEWSTWSTSNASGALASPLKLPKAGYRNENGDVLNINTKGLYWSSTVREAISQGGRTRYGIEFDNGGVSINLFQPLPGLSVRCIKD